MTSLWRSYWEMVQADAPELNMAELNGQAVGLYVRFLPARFIP